MPSGLVRWPRKLWQTCTWLSRPVGWVKTSDSRPIGRLMPSSVRQTLSTNVWAPVYGYTTCFPPFVTFAVSYVMDTVYITWRRTSPHSDRLPASPRKGVHTHNAMQNTQNLSLMNCSQVLDYLSTNLVMLLWFVSFKYVMYNYCFYIFFTLGDVTPCMVYEW